MFLGIEILKMTILLGLILKRFGTIQYLWSMDHLSINR